MAHWFFALCAWFHRSGDAPVSTFGSMVSILD